MKLVLISKIIAFGLIAVFVTGYAYSKTADVIKGPEIIIYSPTENTTVDTNAIEITGQALRIAKIYLNGRQIFTDDEGYFEESLIVPPGYSTLVVEATDIFSRKTRQTIPIVYNNG